MENKLVRPIEYTTARNKELIQIEFKPKEMYVLWNLKNIMQKEMK